MNVFAAIVRQTIKASMRSRVFHILGGALLLAVIVLPLTVKGPGTAVGELQVSLRYSLSAVVLLVCVSALWLGCSNLPREIETYRMHLVRTKPAPPWLIWLGKWFAVFSIHALLFLVAAGMVFGLLKWRISHSEFSDEEMKRLQEEVLIGRRTYTPVRPDFWAQAMQKYREKKEAGELSPNHNARLVMDSLMKRIQARASEVRANEERRWVYRGIGVPKDREAIYCRYRLYVGSPQAQDEQRVTYGLWGIGAPGKPPEQTVYREEKGGMFRELEIPAEHVSADNNLALRYLNLDPDGEPVVFQLKDGPTILVAYCGFLENYARALTLVIMQIAFLAALGCAAGAAFSTPVAVFAGIAYLAMGMTVTPVLESTGRAPAGPDKERTMGQVYVNSLATVMQHVVVSLEEYQPTGHLVKGRLVRWGFIGRGLLQLVVIRGVGLAVIGMFILTRRELGKVIRT